MPLALALVASALIHAAALLGPGWNLPGLDEADGAPAIEAELVQPAASPEAAPAAAPAPKPHAVKPHPKHPAVLAARVTAPADDAVPPPPPVEIPPPIAVAPAPTPAPAETAPPAAVPPAPTTVPAAPAPSVQDLALPARGRVRYVITRGLGGFVVGQTVQTWEHDGVSYKLQGVTETTGLAALFKPAHVVMSSQGEVTAQGLKPSEFRHQRVGGVDTARFDWARGIVAYAGREDSIAAGTQDMLSMYYQLLLLAPGKDALDMPIATGRKLETYHFERMGEEVLALPSGERRAVRWRTRSGNDIVDLWIAPDMRGLPLKIRFTDREGEIFDQVADQVDTKEGP